MNEVPNSTNALTLHASIGTTANSKMVRQIFLKTTFIAMGLFNFFQAKPQDQNKFVTAQAFKDNLGKQIKMTPQTIEQLRKYGVTEDKELKLEYFFYTNTLDKAKAFAKELEKFHYEIKSGQAAGDKKLFIVTGWTTKMKMSDSIVLAWTKQMCEIGYKFDCDFDGWGTDPTQ